MTTLISKNNLYDSWHLNLNGTCKILPDITDSDLKYLLENYNIDCINELSIFNNNQVTSIPILPNLIKLNCNYCYKLTNISMLPKLTNLSCVACTNLTFIPLLPNLSKLNCYRTNITNIPLLPNLSILYCLDCTNLTNIPILPNLYELNCSNCSSLTNIQNLPKLTILNCNYCNSLNLYTIPLKLLSKILYTEELLINAIEHNNSNIEYLESLDLHSFNLSIEIVTTINDIITSSVLVKRAK